ncbi:MAG: adaptor protein MecA [bacterium]|nr:adaptor protein MecA [bacterium]
MNFRKVSDNELRCSVSMDEIRANGLEISDLLKKSDKTYEFFEYLMQEGQEETGFEKTGPMSVEGMFLNGNLELIFRNVEEEELDSWEEAESSEVMAGMSEAQNPIPDENTPLKLVQVTFSTAGRLYQFCQLLQSAEKIPSTLYMYEGKYVLILDLDGCSRSEVGAFCILVNEYGEQSIYGDLQASYIMEHGRFICEDACYRIHMMQEITSQEED